MFTAALAGSVNIVDYNDEYLDEHFKDTESILYYNYQELNSLDRIETLYKNTELLEFMSHNARNVILSGHLWLHRAQQIIDAVKLHKLLH
ncbi:glycosyltransferase [Paenibacillus thiaminolyticus]|uniref:Glycosyltransferase family 1 protein n=1 Tax=Paenibacillus thiaminolyticus TaxID=49283 RepID=A0AAP9DZX6_PANTH|nr:glycosyltransferase family 1 protein [Paenibacillus thiaminolyticus]